MLLLRHTPELTLRTLVARSVGAIRSYSKSKDKDNDYASSSDDEKEAKKSKKQPQGKKPAPAATAAGGDESESAASRLNRLLASMQTDDHYALGAAAGKEAPTLARPGETHKKRKEAAKQTAAAKDVFAAAKRVASMLGTEHKERTESELLSKLLGSDAAAGKGKAAGAGSADDAKSPDADISLSDLIVSMKIDRRQQPKEQTRADFVRRALAAKTRHGSGSSSGEREKSQQARPRRKREPESYTGSVNLFGAEPLGIFKEPSQLRESPDMLATWAQLQQHELKLQTMHPPANYFEKIARWTEQGKVWQFPINNEQDWSEEIDVDFSEHIFLEQHLEPWCPTQGPIRHFMELVCVGLSKNPYITAREKKEHIHWYRDYFEAKKDLLKELMDKGTPAAVKAGKQQLEA